MRHSTLFMARRRPAVIALVAAVLFAGPSASAQLAPSQADRCPGKYVIGPEDVLDVAVWNNTEMTRTVPVRPDGMISLPLLNDVQAAGLTPMELKEVLTRRLVGYMQAPEVSVIVREVHSCKVTVMGEVKNPGRYEIRSRATVLDAIAQAGGFTEFASRSRLAILRPDGRTIVRIPVRYKEAVSGGGDEGRISLK